ncbi:MAG: hypothetical protein LQ346_006513 [Caloplaca aetnensis]|nr:MAG: hypothetical protein LQ346_006513 [Caloplaca aetnensis]
MSSSRNTRRSLKNPKDLVKGIQHLRPRGSYDPLPPPGGFPLPASIRKKFSFAPQLANLSQISLMPDFASSSVALGIELDESEARRVRNETPTSIYIQYSLLGSADTLNVQQGTAVPEPRLHRVDGAENERERLREDDHAVGMMGSGEIETRQSIRPSRSLRRVRGRDSLQKMTASSSYDESDSGSPVFSSIGGSTEPSSPRRACTPLDQDFSDLNTQNGFDCTLQRPRLDEVQSRLVERLAHDTRNLFQSYFIIDLQLMNAVRVTSHDIIPTGLAPDEVIFYDEDLQEIPYKLLTVSDGEKQTQHMLFEGDLVINGGASTQPRHRFIGQIDLTNFLAREWEANEDVWLAIAYEEMEKSGVPRRGKYGRRRWADPAPTVPPHVEAELVPEVLKALHRDYFVIGFSSTPAPHFSITLVSPTLAARKEINHPGFLDWNSLEEQLSGPQPFVTRVQWQSVQLPDKLYCIPMFGPDLVCWLCFLVDGDVPEIWPDSQEDDLAP